MKHSKDFISEELTAMAVVSCCIEFNLGLATNLWSGES